MIRYYVERLRPERFAIIETDHEYLEIDFQCDHIHLSDKRDSVLRFQFRKGSNRYIPVAATDRYAIARIDQRYRELVRRAIIPELIAQRGN
ncbi:MAG: hypothetical protein AAGB22_07880 [Bacteroidota bacterium]